MRSDGSSSYYTGDYKLGLNFFSFQYNLQAWLHGETDGAPPVDTMSVIRYAKQAGFDAVDITAYYIPGYHQQLMPTKPDEEIYHYASQVRELCSELDLAISGTGIKNDFAVPDDERRAMDVKRAKYWIDVASFMGAPVIRLFTGQIPNDIASLGWETIARERIVPALRECAEYAAGKGVIIGMQNHGDMASTAGQIKQLLEWVNHKNIGLVNDTGYFQPFQAPNGLGYDWYADIEAVLPYTVNFQVKRKAAGVHTDVEIDLEELFTRIRYSGYRGYIPLESLWVSSDPHHPGKLTEPPYGQVRDFLNQIKAAAESTKQGPKPLRQ